MSIVFLKIYKGDILLGIKQFSEKQISIGSGQDVNVPLNDPSISPWHCMIEKRGSDYLLTDLGGSEGTFVGPTKILEHPLNPGDEIQIGSFKIIFFIDQPFATSKARVSKTKTTSKKTKTSTKKGQKVSKTKKTSSPPPPPQEIPLPQPTPPPPPSPQSFVDPGFQSNFWKKLSPVRSSKKTFAPPSTIKNLDQIIPPGRGTVVEVIVAWKERIIGVHHSKGNQAITIGSSEKADIQIPNLIGTQIYPIVQPDQITQIYVAKGMHGKIIQNKKEVGFDAALRKGVMTMMPSGHCKLSLGQNELVRVDFHPSLTVYVRYTNPTSKVPPAHLFDFSDSEKIGIGLAICLTLLLFFFVGIYYPTTMEEKEEEEKPRVATIEFKKTFRPKKVVTIKESKPLTRQIKKTPRKPPVAKPKKKTKVVVKKSTKKVNKGQMGQVARKPKKKNLKKNLVTSAKPGGSYVKTKKPAAGAKSPKDPTKTGLLGVLGGKGVQEKLDKAYSGSGELIGLADKSSGQSGHDEIYSGKGVGTKFKSQGAGGKGSNIIGIGSISTKGKSTGQGFGRGVGLGRRGVVELSFGASDADIEGHADRDAIYRVFLRNKAQIESCYNQTLQGNPGTIGKLVLRWRIEGENVSNIRVVNNGTRSSRLVSCVKSRIQNWKFPGAITAGDAVDVTFPFNFTKG